MKNFNKKQMKKLDAYFKLYEDDEILQLESWTDGGVDMAFYIYKNENVDYLKQFKNYIENFDIDEEIEIHRQDKQYRNDFSISESLKDFKDYLEELRKIYKILEKLENGKI